MVYLASRLGRRSTLQGALPTMSSSQVACTRCRTQKVPVTRHASRMMLTEPQLRCDRVQPQCSRCLKFRLLCAYPDPPDRKLIAAQRRPPRRRTDRALQTNVKPRSGNDKVVVAIIDDMTEESRETMISIYFTYVFKASLIYHRPSFESDLREQRLPQHSLLGVCALAMK